MVSDLTERGEYLDAHVKAGGFDYRLFFYAEPACRQVLQTERITFTWLGPIGRLADDEGLECDAVGVLSLRKWRDRQPRRSREPLPRAPARYEVVYRDTDLVQLTGRFPLVSHLGFQGRGQLILVLPSTETCAAFADVGTASMEFRASGSNPLVLLNKSDLCPVLGVVLPPSQNPTI